MASSDYLTHFTAEESLMRTCDALEMLAQAGGRSRGNAVEREAVSAAERPRSAPPADGEKESEREDRGGSSEPGDLACRKPT